jgi:hypothetical protein
MLVRSISLRVSVLPLFPLLAVAVGMVVLDQGTVYFRYRRITEGTASLVPRRAGNRNRSQFIELLLRARLLLSFMLWPPSRLIPYLLFQMFVWKILVKVYHLAINSIPPMFDVCVGKNKALNYVPCAPHTIFRFYLFCFIGRGNMAYLVK